MGINLDIDCIIKIYTRCMYIIDAQFKLWHDRIATNKKLYKMKIINHE